MNNRLFLSSLLLLTLVSAIFAQPHYTEIPSDDLHDEVLVNSAKNAVRKHNEDTGSNIAFVSIVSGSEAVFQGHRWYRLLIKAHDFGGVGINAAANSAPAHNYNIEFFTRANEYTILRFARAE